MKAAALEQELSRMRASYDTQQNLFHDSIAAANRQVGVARGRGCERRKV